MCTQQNEFHDGVSAPGPHNMLRQLHNMLQQLRCKYVTLCCSALQSVAVCCSLLHSVVIVWRIQALLHIIEKARETASAKKRGKE